MTQRSGPAAVLGRKSRLLLLPFTIAALLAFSASPALAAKTHHLVTTFIKGTSGNQFGSALGLGIDESSENVVVGNLRQKVNGPPAFYFLDVVGPEGEEPSAVASPFSVEVYTSQGDANHAGVAVDNSSTSPSKGSLYVPDIENHVVKKFALNPLSEEYELKGTLGVTNPLDVAVDTKGNVFVVDKDSKSIAKFDPAGSEVGQIAVGFLTRSVAVDGKGDLYVQEAPQGQSDVGKVVELPANGSGEIEPGTQPIEIASGNSSKTRPRAIAVDQVTNELYVAFLDHVEQFSSAGAQTGEFDLNALNVESNLIAVNGQTGLVYVFGPGEFFGLGQGVTPGVGVFGPSVVVPDVTTKAVSDLTVTSASLNGTISAAGGLSATCEFEYTDDASFQAEGFEGSATAPCSPGGPFSGTSAEPVSAAIGPLTTQTLYDYRLVGSSENGTIRGKTLKFFTPGPPLVDGESVSGLTGTTATLEALVNPDAGETSYVFEYVTEASFDASGYASATIVPLGGEAVGSGFEDVGVAQQIGGLSPSTNYLFRVVATNPQGTISGPDRFFTTLGPNGFELPDGRAYEQVTPVDKNGSAPVANNGKIQAAAGGDGITYISRGGIPGGEGAQKYPFYLASRGSDWSSQGLLPPASAGSAAGVLGWSEDLSKAYLSQADLPGTATDLLERDNGTRSLRSIAAEGSDLGTFKYVGASANGMSIFFESDTVLYPGGAAKSPNLYVWDKTSEELTLAGVLNSGLATKGTFAGSNEPGFREHYLQAQHTVSSDGARVFFTDLGGHQLYLRQNPTQPQSLLDGQGKCTEISLACTVQVSASQRAVADPKGKKPAVFWGATPDGSQSFFSSSGKLTDDATTGPGDEGNDLYRYDADTGLLTDIAPDATDTNGAEVQGVLGTSSDGSYVYFAANGVLAAGATPGNCTAISYGEAGTGSCNLYLSHDGAIVFISRLAQNHFNPTSDAANWISEGISQSNIENTARVTPDGKTLLFRSQLPLTGYDGHCTGPDRVCLDGRCAGGPDQVCPEFFRYSATDGELECVSCDPSGAAPRGSSTLRSISTTAETGPAPAAVLTRNLSASGSRIFFETPDKLVASDTDGDDGCPRVGGLLRAELTCQDVYEWEANGAGSCHSARQNGGCLYLISSGASSEASYFADADREGNNAFFFTEQSLVGQDRDQIADLYDARVGGGIASQNPPPPPPVCEGEACKGSVAPPPIAESPGSASFSTLGDPKPSRHHKKKQHKKKKQQHKKKRHSVKRSG